MTLLNRASDGLSTVLLTMFRASRLLGPREEAEFKALLAPGTLAERGAEKMIRQTLTRWSQIGFFEVEKGRLVLAEGLENVEFRFEVQPDLCELRKATLRQVLEMAATEGVDTVDDAVSGAWWFLSFDPFSHPIRNFEDVQRTLGETGTDPYLIQNDTRWQGLLDWMQFWGLCLRSYSSFPFVPNPAEALGWFLDDLLEKGERTAVIDFLRRLNEDLPIVPILMDGPVTNSISAKLPGQARPLQESGSKLSVSLSLALETLQAAGLLKLIELDIADRWFLTHEDGRYAVTHLLREG
jgi:hypothetical protein